MLKDNHQYVNDGMVAVTYYLPFGRLGVLSVEQPANYFFEIFKWFTESIFFRCFKVKLSHQR
jgi:hypothetical protein